MKKLIILVSLFLFIPCVNALKIDSLGLTMDLPSELTPITRENINEDKYDYIGSMYKNEIYLQTKEYNNLIIYLRAVENPGIQNYSKDTDLDYEIIALKKIHENIQYKYITSDKYKWIRLNYTDTNSNKELLEYYLSWNNIFITITVQPVSDKLNLDNFDYYDNIIKTITLTGDGKAEVNPIYDDGLDKFNNGFNKNYIGLIIICFVVIIFTYYITRKKKK